MRPCAREVNAIFDQLDVLIDLHQTILDTQQPFYIFPWTEQSGLWAKAMGVATVCVDATPDPSKPIMTQCAMTMSEHWVNLTIPSRWVKKG